ncbi:hypothetical protein [Marivita sp.]|uniref:hypothetical protein n=1 Tax=Marivita sp. TaxID=2003365 RepID=UPI0026193FD7|nr:hypothetical protein [Marivita sp.]
MSKHISETAYYMPSLQARIAGFSLAVSLATTSIMLGDYAHADTPIVHLFEFAEGNADLLEGYLPQDVIRTVAKGTPAPGLDFKVLLGTPDLGLGHDWSIAQLITDQTCNPQGECEIHVRRSSPDGWVTAAEVMAVDVSWLEDGSAPSPLIFSWLQGPAIWRWDGASYVFDQIGDDDIADAYYAATGGDN